MSNASPTSLELAQFPSTVVQPLLLGCFCLSVLYLIPGVDNMPKLTAPLRLFVFCVCVCAHFVPQQNKLTYFWVALNLGSGKKILFWWGFGGVGGASQVVEAINAASVGVKTKKMEWEKKFQSRTLYLNLKQQTTVKSNSGSHTQTKSFCKARDYSS